jgi:hypothetical protein
MPPDDTAEIFYYVSPVHTQHVDDQNTLAHLKKFHILLLHSNDL